MIDDSARVWVDSMAAAYDRALGSAIFEPFAIRLAARVADREPSRILEVAAGTGVLTRELVRLLPDATVVATDLNEAMVRFGAQRVPQAEWLPADAMSLPFDDGDFDVVVCQFGAMFFPDRVAGYAEARRVIRPGGALMFNVWAEVERHSYERVIVEALRRVFPEDPPTFLESVPHGYANRARIEDDVRAAGFADVAALTAEVSSEVASTADLIAGYCEGTPLRAEFASRGDLAQLAPRMIAEVESILGPGPLTGTMAAHEIVGLTPGVR